MTDSADADERAIEALWWEHFGEPPPIRGCPELALELLCEAAANEGLPDSDR